MQKYSFIFLVLVLTLTSCTSAPQGVTPVDNFEVERYMGKWYEIARLDHSFERGLQNVTAEYGLNDDGTVSVLNQGVDQQNCALKRAKGVAKFKGDKTIGSLKVSFFGPFYGGYHIFALDHDDYEWAMISGPSKKYFWILSRTPHLNDDIYNDLIQKAEHAGFDLDDIIIVLHDALSCE